MLKELIAKIRGKPKTQPAPSAPVVPAGLFWYNVVQPGEACYFVYVVDRQQREVSRYRVWVN